MVGSQRSSQLGGDRFRKLIEPPVIFGNVLAILQKLGNQNVTAGIVEIIVRHQRRQRCHFWITVGQPIAGCLALKSSDGLRIPILNLFDKETGVVPTDDLEGSITTGGRDYHE